MEKPKPPASSQIRRPSTRPYARRKRETQAAEATASSTESAAQLGHQAAAAIAEPHTPAGAKVAAARPRAKSRSKEAPRSLAAAPTAEAASLDAIDLAAVDAAVATALLDAPAVARDAVIPVDSAAPIEPILEAATVPLTLPIAAPLHNAFAETAMASVEAAIAAAVDAAGPGAATAPITSLSQLSPQEISEASASSLAVLSAALQLTELPSPRQLPTGAPTDAAPPPGLVPRGDSRSLRRGELFALVYRVHSFVITRHGKVGQLGHWSAVEYPTPSAASHAYARGCSHWVSEGFSDYRG